MKTTNRKDLIIILIGFLPVILALLTKQLEWVALYLPYAIILFALDEVNGYYY